MESYLHLFETEQEFDAQYKGSGYTEPWVSYTMETSAVSFNKDEREKLLETPLTFEIISGGTIVWKAQNTAYTATIEYSLDNGTNWSALTSNTGSSAPSFSVNDGDKVIFRGNNDSYANDTSSYNSFGASTALFNVKGNIMSLIKGDNFATASTLESAYTFEYLFQQAKVIDASKLVLPATTLANYCYQNMFSYCTSLTQAPELPATTLVSGCYKSMFSYCTSLTTAPTLPATTLADGCYQGMFSNCTKLAIVPESLPATALTNHCYSQMFYSCAKLTSAPALPATTLTQSCYNYMFSNCMKLNYIKCLATDISADSCTSNWVASVSSTGTFVTPSSTQWATSYSGIPTGWTRVDA